MGRSIWKREVSPSVVWAVIVVLVAILIGFGWWYTRPKNPPPPGIQPPPPEVLDAIKRSKEAWEQRNMR